MASRCKGSAVRLCPPVCACSSVQYSRSSASILPAQHHLATVSSYFLKNSPCGKLHIHKTVSYSRRQWFHPPRLHSSCILLAFFPGVLKSTPVLSLLFISDHKRRLVFLFHFEFRWAACTHTRSQVAKRSLRCWAPRRLHFSLLFHPSIHCISPALVFVWAALRMQCRGHTS